MMRNRKRIKPCRIVAALSLITAVAPFASGQGSLRARPQIGKIDDARRTVLVGNLRSAANAGNDRGAVQESLALDHMILQLKRSPEQDAALDAYIKELNDASSPNYHKWLTPEEMGEQYGPAKQDIDAVTSWLKQQGFTVNSVATNGMTVDFSGTAKQVQKAFGTSIHKLSVDGEAHIANMQDPSIPSAMAGVVSGVVSLHDFKPVPLHHKVKAAHFDPRTGSQTNAGETVAATSGVHGDYTYTSSSGGSYQALVPGDLATIYNLSPLFAAGISGQGQKIVVIEDTNVYSTADWTNFRNAFGLSAYTAGSFTQIHPGNCTSPGVNSADGEAILDAEWASAAAPSAQIQLASCADTKTTFGGLIALQNLLNDKTNTARIVSISYGESESEMGTTANAAYNSAYQQAAAQGISVFVASGDEGAASSDANATSATHGITVSGFATTPYNVAVGGTDFGDTYAGTNTSYWNSTNTNNYDSAKSYIPEIPWNNSCASQLIASKSGYSTTYGSNGFCNSSKGQNFLTTGSGSGGPSACASGTAKRAGVVSGTCKGYAKPAFQAGLVGVPSDGVRDIPDVSLFAANGVWGHYYVFCYSDPTAGYGGASCSGAPSSWSGAGGTSFAAPIMGAIQALVNQKTASAWGNPLNTYYNLARAEYGSTGNSNCNSSNGAAGTSGCTFYDVTQGDIDVNCTGSYNCYKPSGTYGVLSTSSSSYQPAYGSGTGWDFSTGIGTVNAYNLVNNWGTVSH